MSRAKSFRRRLGCPLSSAPILGTGWRDGFEGTVPQVKVAGAESAMEAEGKRGALSVVSAADTIRQLMPVSQVNDGIKQCKSRLAGLLACCLTHRGGSARRGDLPFPSTQVSRLQKIVIRTFACLVTHVTQCFSACLHAGTMAHKCGAKLCFKTPSCSGRPVD